MFDCIFLILPLYQVKLIGKKLAAHSERDHGTPTG